MIRSKIFILLGPPGSGKGTLSAMCIEHFGWIQLSTGNLCRDHIARKTSIGIQIADLIAQGKLVPDEIIAQLVADWLTSQKEMPAGILFDGYPRTKVQAELFDKMMQAKAQMFDIKLIKLEVDADVLFERIANRWICSNKNCGKVYSASELQQHDGSLSMICPACKSALIRRVDDTPESLKKRLEVYFSHEQEIVDFYIDKGFPVCSLNGAQEISIVFENFKKIALNDHGC